MRAWTVDADDIRVADDFDETLLHRTPEIDAFLAADRDDKFIVIGTKGFGKTLLLKAKRILLQREGTTACLPHGNLLDKPIGDKIFGREEIAYLAAAPLPWSKVWLAAIALAVLKHFRDTEGLKVSPRLTQLLRDAQLHSVIDHFVRLLDLPPGELQRAATDTDGHLVPRLRASKMPVAIFIDGIDEYFNKHVEDGPSAHLNPSVTGELSPQVWYFAQLGLVEVAYQLRRINHHLKVFAAIRKEAYASLPKRTAMAQQYRGSAVDIVYPPQSLREIFVNNVRLLKSDRMVRPNRVRTNPLEAFLGRSTVVDATTQTEEDALEYLCRHTLLRPRDLMTLGERLAALRPEERRHEPHLKEAVNQAAGEIAHEYLAEVAPYLGELDLERLWAVLPGPVLTHGEVEAIVAGDGQQHGFKRMFCALHQVGLLGHVQHDRVRGQWRQRFLRPGEASIDIDGTLPPAAHYLLHPVLADVIGRLNTAYLQRLDAINVIGYDRPWHEAGAAPHVLPHEQSLNILKADVQGFGQFMRAGTDGLVRRALEQAVRRWAPPGSVSETASGDAALIVADDAVAIAQTARHLIDDVYQTDGQPRLRVALHHGTVLTHQRDPAAPASVVGGDGLLVTARVEPVVEAGQIWATEEFRAQLQQRPSLWRSVALKGSGADERFDVHKPGTDEGELWVRLYRLEL